MNTLIKLISFVWIGILSTGIFGGGGYCIYEFFSNEMWNVPPNVISITAGIVFCLLGIVLLMLAIWFTPNAFVVVVITIKNWLHKEQENNKPSTF